MNPIRAQGQSLNSAISRFEQHSSGVSSQFNKSTDAKSINDFVDHIIGMNMSVREVQINIKTIQSQDEILGYILDLRK